MTHRPGLRLTSALLRLGLALGVLVLAFAAAAVPAGAVVVEAEGVGVGLQPRSTGLLDGLVQAKPKPGETP